MHPAHPLGHIVAMGGGGFSMEDDHRMDDFILSLAPRQPARICFVPTASADSATYLVKFYRAFSGRAIATDLTIFDPPSVPRRPRLTSEIAAHVAEQDIIYVGGGSTANLLAIWRMHGVDKILRDAWTRGAILCGVSAGMLCWFRGGVTDSFGDMDAIRAASASSTPAPARTTTAKPGAAPPISASSPKDSPPVTPLTTAPPSTSAAPNSPKPSPPNPAPPPGASSG